MGPEGFKGEVWRSERRAQNCVKARLGKKKRSAGDNGLQYACVVCELRMRLCVVARSDYNLVLLPGKEAVDNGRGPADATFWVR